MKTFLQPGDTISVTAPADVTAGNPVQVGQLFGLAVHDALETESVEIARKGVYTVDEATSGETWTAGELIYWDGTAFTDTPGAGDLLVGYAAAAKGSGTTTAKILLDGVARVDEA